MSNQNLARAKAAKNDEFYKMVPFYGTVYKSSLYNLIIPFPACESGAERKKRRAECFCVREDLQKENNLIKNSLWIVFYVEWHQLSSSLPPCEK